MIALKKLDSLRGDPEELIKMKSVSQLVDDLAKAGWLLWLAGTAAFLASAMFVVKYFVGGDLTPTLWTGEQWTNALLGLLLTLVVTFGQGLLYTSGYKGLAAVLATFIVVFFGLFSEISQSMEREDATVRHRSENSPVFQAALGSIKTLSIQAAAPSPARQELAAAQGEVLRWEEEQQKKAKCHTCSEYSTRTIGSKLAAAKGRVAAAQAQAAAWQSGNASALSSAIAEAKKLEYDEDKHYGMIRLLKAFFGIVGIYASFLFSLVIIGTFEYIFHFIGSYVANHRKALQLLGRNADGLPFDTTTPGLPAVSGGSSTGVSEDGSGSGSGSSSGSRPARPAGPMPGMQPADRFARDLLRMDYSATNPVYPMPGFAPDMSVLAGLAGGLSGVTGKVRNAGSSSGKSSASADKDRFLTGKAKDGGGEVWVSKSVYLTLCRLVSSEQLRPSRPGIKKALQQMKVGNNQVERQAMADLILEQMHTDRVVYRNPDYTGPHCGLSEFLAMLAKRQPVLALAG